MQPYAKDKTTLQCTVLVRRHFATQALYVVVENNEIPTIERPRPCKFAVLWKRLQTCRYVSEWDAKKLQIHEM